MNFLLIFAAIALFGLAALLLSRVPNRAFAAVLAFLMAAGGVMACASAAMPQTPPPPPNARPAVVQAAPALPPALAPGQASSGEVIVKTIESIELSPNPAEALAKLSPQIVGKIGKGGDTVRLVGSSRGSKASGGSESTIGQIVWNGVQAEVNGRKRMVPLDKPLTSQFVARATALPPGTDVKAAGDEATIIAAAKKLFDVPAETTTKAEPKDKKADSSAKPVGGGGSSNEVASQGYQAAPAVMKAEVPDLPVAYGVTTEGCTPRVDEAQGVVIIQSKQTKSEGGAVQDAGECSDSEMRYIIQKSYSSCEDRVDLPGRQAFAQYRKYWTDDQGRTSFLGECADDPEMTFAIEEDRAACTYEIDMTGMMAFERAELVYTNRNNQRISVQSCQRTADGGHAVSRTATGCSIRHDFTGHVSVQQKKLVYDDADGSVVTAAECTDDSTESYAHEDVRGVCADLVDQTGQKAWPQRRWRITVSGTPQFISECEPVQEEAASLVATVQGCETIFYHYLDQGQSFGAHRYYYSFDAVNRSYVTGCQQSPQAYAHLTETQGYEYNDPQKTAKPKTAIYINTGVGRVDVSAAQVRDGAPTLAYLYLRQATTALPDQKYWEACNAYIPTAKADFYQRPDTTEVSYQVGPGPVSGPVDECQRLTETQSGYGFHRGTGETGAFQLYANGDFNSRVSWPLSGPGDAVVGQQYNGCGHAGPWRGGYIWAQFEVFNSTQNRTKTIYPSTGDVSYTAWQTVSNAIVATFGCDEAEYSPE